MRSNQHFDGNISYKRLYYLDLHNTWAGETNHADPRVNVGIFYIQALNDSNEHICHLFTILYMQLQHVIKADTHAITIPYRETVERMAIPTLRSGLFPAGPSDLVRH